MKLVLLPAYQTPAGMASGWLPAVVVDGHAQCRFSPGVVRRAAARRRMIILCSGEIHDAGYTGKVVNGEDLDVFND